MLLIFLSCFLIWLIELSIPEDYLLSYIALNVLFMTHKAATWIISRKALSPFIDPLLQSSQWLLPIFHIFTRPTMMRCSRGKRIRADRRRWGRVTWPWPLRRRKRRRRRSRRRSNAGISRCQNRLFDEISSNFEERWKCVISIKHISFLIRVLSRCLHDWTQVQSLSIVLLNQTFLYLLSSCYIYFSPTAKQTKLKFEQ